MEQIKLVTSFCDDRGEIIDMVENETINAVTLLTLKKGAIRGNHYHKNTYQWNYLLSGKIKISCQIPGETVKVSIMKKGDFILTKPNERHALIGMEESELLVLTKGPRSGTEYESDTFRLDQPLEKN